MAHAANEALMDRVQIVASMMRSLTADLNAHGDHDLADAFKRASRELATVDRQGLLTARGQEL